MKLYDEHHEYRVDTQRWTKWPKALIMTHEWSTNGHDRRIEQRRYVPDDYATKLEMENSRVKAQAEYQKKLADEELEEAHEIRHNIDRLRERVHEIAADRDRIKAENAKLRACLDDSCAECAIGMGKYADSLCDPIKAENAKLRELVAHLAYVKPAQVTAITHDGKLFRFDEKLEEVGMRYEAES